MYSNPVVDSHAFFVPHSDYLFLEKHVISKQIISNFLTYLSWIVSHNSYRIVIVKMSYWREVN